MLFVKKYILHTFESRKIDFESLEKTIQLGKKTKKLLFNVAFIAFTTSVLQVASPLTDTTYHKRRRNVFLLDPPTWRQPGG